MLFHYLSTVYLNHLKYEIMSDRGKNANTQLIIANMQWITA